MGNEITAIAPSQILPIESYFSSDDTVSEIEVLSSTRFFKTVRGIHRGGGEAVVKVLVKYDLPDHHTRIYHAVLSDVREKLQSVPNSLPYISTWETDKAAYLLRQHVRHNLYDMYSSRPALSSLEKKWIVYQLLQSLKDSHQQKSDGKPTCHGDIKSENVLLTGWNWVYLSDYAPFKPTELPMDDPGDYDFYFDTSRRRTCYIATERFIDPSHRTPDPKAPLTEAMDIFSLGCVVGEMFSDGRQLFNLSELLEYKRQQNKPQLKWIKDEDVKTMVEHMIQHDPTERFTAAEYLHVFDEKIFPVYFGNFLHQYMGAFTHGVEDFEGSLKPDQRIQRLYTDIHKILLNVVFINREDTSTRESGYGDGMLIVLSAITSHVRVLQFMSTKLQSLEMMKMISHHIQDEFILDRVVPYLLHFVSDLLPEVKAEAIRTLTHCLSMVTKLPKGDVNIFQDYIFPRLLLIYEDLNVNVRVALAESIAELTETAHRFLEIGLHNASLVSDEEYQTLGSYDNELSLMRTQVAKMVTAFLSDQDNIVKKTTMLHLKKLCPFFGFQQAKDVILVHLITYLNDKEDWELHLVFFECIVDVVAYLGWPAVELVQELLLQGLNDPEEQVISKAIDAIASMLKLNLFKLQQILEFVDQIRPFLIHPNMWIRYAAVGFVVRVAEELGPIDSACFLVQKLSLYLQEQVVDMTDQFVLLSVLKPPLSRQIYDYILRQPNLKEFFELLTDRQSVRSLARPGYPVKYATIPARFDPIFRRFSVMGMNESVEDQLLILQDVIWKIHTSRQFASDLIPPNGMVDLETLSVTGEAMKFEIVDEQWFPEPLEVPTPSDEPQPLSVEKSKRESDDVDEWNLMFGEESHSKLKIAPVRGQGSGSDRQSLPNRSATLVSARSGHRASIQHDSYLDIEQNLPSQDVRGSLPKSRRIRHRRSRSDTTTLQAAQGKEYGFGVDGKMKAPRIESTWYKSLEQLQQHKSRQYNLGQQALLGKVPWENGFFRVLHWRSEAGSGPLKLVSHLQEHKSAINRVRVSRDTSMFATFSSDSTVKLWDATKLDQQPFILKAKYTQKSVGKILTGVFCNNSTSIAFATSEGSVNVFNFDNQQSKASLVLSQVHEQDLSRSGYVVDMFCLDASRQQSHLCCATSLGTIFGIDLRAGKIVWTLKQEYNKGMLTSLAVDPWETWTASGTSIGYHIIWDLRFQLPINSWQYCDGNLAGPVHRLSPHPQSHSYLLSALEGNNEVSSWNMETGQKNLMLWGSHLTPPFSRASKESRNMSVRAISSGYIDGDPVILTAGTDRRIRMWNVANPELSSCLLMPVNTKESEPCYRHKMIEGIRVITEVEDMGLGVSHRSTQELDQLGVPHIDIINDMVVLQRSAFPYVISAGNNGELKIWR